MSRQFFDSLEKRQLFAVTPMPDVADAAAATTSRAPVSAADHGSVRDPSAKANLTAAEVETILGQAASQARPGQVIVVMDDEGVTLGVYAMTGSNDNVAPDGTAYPTGVPRLTEIEQLVRAASARAARPRSSRATRTRSRRAPHASSSRTTSPTRCSTRPAGRCTACSSAASAATTCSATSSPASPPSPATRAASRSTRTA